MWIRKIPDHLWQCLNDIGVDRIDHGVNSLEDAKLCEEIKKRQLGLTVCPISNGCVADSVKAKEIKQMLDTGMRVTVNSDDPAYFQGYLTENIKAICDEVRFSKADLVELQKNDFRASWLSDEEKEGYLKRLNDFECK